MSEEIEGRVSKKLSQEFSRTKSRILGALTKLDEFLSNQQIHTHFETVPGTFRNKNVENQGTNEDDSQSDPHPEAGIFRGQTTQNLGPKACRDNTHSECRKQFEKVYHLCLFQKGNAKFTVLLSFFGKTKACENIEESSDGYSESSLRPRLGCFRSRY